MSDRMPCAPFEPDFKMPTHPFVYLASQSPRRQELLQQLGVRFELLLPRPDEDAEALEAELPGESRRCVCRARVRVEGARRARAARCGRPCARADPRRRYNRHDRRRDPRQAAARRRRRRDAQTPRGPRARSADGARRGRCRRRAARPALSRSKVRFARADRAALQRYAASGEPLGKAGAYGVQGRAAEFIEHIDGSYSGIMGLPLFETAALLRAARIDF